MKDPASCLGKYWPLLIAACSPAWLLYMMFKEPAKFKAMMERARRRERLELRYEELMSALLRLDARWMATWEEPTVNEMLEEEIERHCAMLYGTTRALCDLSPELERGFRAWYKLRRAAKSELVRDKKVYADTMLPIVLKEMR